MNSIAQRIRKVRGNRTQAEFAQLLEINPNTLRAYEKGRAVPGQDLLERLCVKFSVNPQWILMGSGEMYRTETGGLPGTAEPRVEQPLEERVCYLEQLLRTRDETIATLVASLGRYERLLAEAQDEGKRAIIGAADSARTAPSTDLSSD